MNSSETNIPSHIIDRRQEQRHRKYKKRRLAAGSFIATALAAGGTLLYAPLNRAIDRMDGISPQQLAAAGHSRPVQKDRVKMVTFEFKGVGDNSLSFAAAKYAPHEDPLEAADRIAAYLPIRGQDKDTVFPGEAVTFPVDTKTGDVVPKETPAEQGGK